MGAHRVREVLCKLSYETCVRIWISNDEYNSILNNDIKVISDITNEIKNFIDTDRINTSKFIITESTIKNLEE